MRQTPEVIWLREDEEDPDNILWSNDQPGDGGVAYVRADVIDKYDSTNPTTMDAVNKLSYRDKPSSGDTLKAMCKM